MRRPVLLLGLSFLASKLLGLLRDHLLASRFGIASENVLFHLDTYYAAFRIPDLLFNLLSYGILSAAFVPFFIEVLKKENREEAFRFSNQVLHAVGFLVLIISLVFFAAAPWFMKIFVPGFSSEDLRLTVQLTRLMLLTPILFTVSSIASGIQNAFHRFLGLSLAGIFYNLGILAGIVFWAPRYGVFGVAAGVVIGAFLSVLVQLPSIMRLGYRYSLPAKLFFPRVKEMLLVSAPRIFGMSVSQLALVIDTILASLLPLGSITILNFAANLQSLPMGLIGISVAVVSFGTLSEFHAEGKMPEFIQEMKNNLMKILFLLIPLTVGMIEFRREIVKLIFEQGQFSMQDSALTAQTLAFFLIGLSFGGIVFLLARGFYALKNTRTPVYIGIFAVLLHLGGSVVAVKVFNAGIAGLALANSIADTANALLLLFFLQRRLQAPLVDIKKLGKIIISTMLAWLSLRAIKFIFGGILLAQSSFVTVLVQTALLSLFAAGMYYIAIRVQRA